MLIARNEQEHQRFDQSERSILRKEALYLLIVKAVHQADIAERLDFQLMD